MIESLVAILCSSLSCVHVINTQTYATDAQTSQVTHNDSTFRSCSFFCCRSVRPACKTHEHHYTHMGGIMVLTRYHMQIKHSTQKTIRHSYVCGTTSSSLILFSFSITASLVAAEYSSLSCSNDVCIQQWLETYNGGVLNCNVSTNACPTTTPVLAAAHVPVAVSGSSFLALSAGPTSRASNGQVS